MSCSSLIWAGYLEFMKTKFGKEFDVSEKLSILLYCGSKLIYSLRKNVDHPLCKWATLLVWRLPWSYLSTSTM